MKLTQRLFYFFPLLFSFCLPFGSNVLSLIIILWGISSFFNLEKQKLIHGLKNRDLWLFWSFFILTGFSAIFSDNRTEALFSIEVKLSMIFLPYFFYCFDWKPELIKTSLVSFVSGCFFASIYLIMRASVYAAGGQPEYFFYTLFSDLMHASYFAMYLVLALTIIILFYGKWFKDQKGLKYLYVFFSAVFILTIFLCSSKIGIITLCLIIPLAFIIKWRNALTWKNGAMLVAGMILILAVSYQLFPGTFARLASVTQLDTSKIDKTSSESTTVRVLIWQESFSIIRENFLTGVGVGDANDELYAAYENNGLTGAFEHKLNAHNQYLQSFIGLGIIGFVLLFAMTFGNLYYAILSKNNLLLILSLLLISNFLVESMLQRSAGVLFTVFFLCLFNLRNFKHAVEH